MELLPREVSPDPDDPEVRDVTSQDAGDAFEALASDTARAVLATVYAEPATPSEVREEVGTTLQNVHYHLERLEEADLVEPAGTGYSEKGNEMTVYAPATEALVLFAGRDHDRSRVEGLLRRVFAMVSGLSIAAVAVDWWLGDPAGTEPVAETGDGGVGVATTDGPRVAAEAGKGAGGAGQLLADPVLLFFLGGLVGVALLSVWWARTAGR